MVNGLPACARMPRLIERAQPLRVDVETERFTRHRWQPLAISSTRPLLEGACRPVLPCVTCKLPSICTVEWSCDYIESHRVQLYEIARIQRHCTVIALIPHETDRLHRNHGRLQCGFPSGFSCSLGSGRATALRSGPRESKSQSLLG